jgi:quercetin dioxygenase-like cupin family protein
VATKFDPMIETPGDVIANPFSGERIVIRRHACDTGGRILEFDLYLPPGTHVPAGHVHPGQEERFTVLEGRMQFRFGRRHFEAGPGDTVVVPPSTGHWFGNAGDGVAHARVEARPALRLEELFAATAAMGSHARFGGLPRLTELIVVLHEYRQEVGTPGIAGRAVGALLAPMAWILRNRPGSRAPR